MLQVPHTITGLVISSRIDSLIWAPLVSLVFHFLMDMIPHWDFFTNGKRLYLWRRVAIIVDFLVALTIALAYMFLVRSDPRAMVNALLCSFASNLPDALEIPYFLGFPNAITKFVLRVQSFLHWRSQLPWGLVPQLCLALLGLIFLFWTR